MMNKKMVFALICTAMLIAPIGARANTLYEFQFEGADGKKSLVNTGTLAGTADDQPVDSTAVEYTHKTQSGTGVALSFPMTPDGTRGPTLILPGSDKQLALGDAKSEMTIAMWIRWAGPDKVDTNDLQFLVSKMAASQDEGWAFGITDKGALRFLIGDYGSRYTKAVVTPGKWTHIAVVYRPSVGLHFYIDGKEAEADQDLGATTVKPSKEPIIVGTATEHTLPCNAAIDDLKLCDEALGSEDVEALMSPPQPAK